MNNVANTLQVKNLGRQPYEKVWQQMKSFTDKRDSNTVDQCWVVEHDPVFTLGQAGKEEHILTKSEIAIVKSDRGGQVTYHGPGQLVFYFLIDIKRKKISVRAFVSLMEQAVIALLKTYHIQAELKDGAPGVYVNQAKIASLGLRVRKGCTYHGLSLNVDMDLSPFQQINPCGYEGLQVIQLKDQVNTSVDFVEIQEQLLRDISDKLNYDLV